jgi:hypothetical protein
MDAEKKQEVTRQPNVTENLKEVTTEKKVGILWSYL